MWNWAGWTRRGVLMVMLNCYWTTPRTRWAASWTTRAAGRPTSSRSRGAGPKLIKSGRTRNRRAIEDGYGPPPSRRTTGRCMITNYEERGPHLEARRRRRRRRRPGRRRTRRRPRIVGRRRQLKGELPPKSGILKSLMSSGKGLLVAFYWPPKRPAPSTAGPSP